jgi:hypothetical protein
MKKAISKTSKPIKDDGELSKNRTVMEMMGDESLLNNPSRDEWRERLIKTMLNWGRSPDSLDIVQFCMQYQIPRASLYEWAQKYPKVGWALEQMKLNLGCNRRIGSMTRKLDGAYAYKDMHKHDPEWIEINKYNADLKRNEEQVPTTFNIYTGKPPVKSAQDLKREIDEIQSTTPLEQTMPQDKTEKREQRESDTGVERTESQD